ncbi:choice-of-anchor D domain-containing protein [Microbacterium mangrovi]|uniref:choice-of-anchor D domain-containing protein n=1 Tax=Microbacterium mangrovi TaxID=1348253 RepID=UPI0006921C1E|nr:choice-of-anchor D domain-containing protein [Microbacterium mangrovi]
MRPAACALAVLVVLAGVLTGTAPSRAVDETVSHDALRTGWDSNEPRLTPTDVTASDFGKLFATQVSGQIYAQPVVSHGVLLVATENDQVSGLDPVTGAVKWQRSVGPAWPAATLGCGDLAPNVGITATPVVDSATGTAYFTAKVNDGATAASPHWYLHAIDITTGAERAGFPTTIAGSPSNDPGHPFNPETAMQRPGLLLLGGVVYAAFGSHCDHGPYVGYVVGVNATSGAQTTMWSTEAGSASQKAGIWQSGGGIVSDGPGRLFVTTGNGVSPAPSPGSSPPNQLAESVVRLQVNPDGRLSARDFFSPVNNTNLDRDDSDLGAAGPVALPDGYGSAAHPHLLVQGGKDGRIFLLDRDDLGGMGQGAGGTDKVLQALGPYRGMWGHPAFWGGSGGYVYTITSDGPLSAFQVTKTAAGMPALALVGQTTDTWGHTSGSPVVTSDGATSGSALVWAVDNPGTNGVGASLRAYDAVPVNGVLALRYSIPIGTGAKFSVAATDAGRVYVGTRDGVVYGVGRPTTSPLTGSGTDFGFVAVGSTATANVTVTAAKSVTIQSAATTGPFSIGTPAPTLPVTLAVGDTVTIPVTAQPTATGAASGTIELTTDAGPVSFGLQVTGTAPGLSAAPTALDFGIVPTSARVTYTVSIANTDSVPETVSAVTGPSAPFTTVMPAVGTVIPAAASISLPVTFAPTTATGGPVNTTLVVATSAGSVTVPISGTGVVGASHLAIGPMSIAFGAVPAGTAVRRSFTIQNTGNIVLTIMKAAPPTLPFTAVYPIAEGQQLEPGDSLSVPVQFAPTKGGTFTGTYIVTGDDGTGAKTITLTGTGVPRGPIRGLNGSCVDVRHSSTVNGTIVQTYRCNGTAAQIWTLPAGHTVRAFGKCLDVYHSARTNGARVDLWSCNGTGAQVWVLGTHGSLRNPQSGKCLTDASGRGTSSVALVIRTCTAAAAQTWTIPH